MLINKINITLCEGDYVALFLDTSSHRYCPSLRSLHKCAEAFPRPYSMIISSTAPSPFLDVFFSYVLYLLSTAFALRYTAERSPEEGEAHLSAPLLCLKIGLAYSKPSINIC